MSDAIEESSKDLKLVPTETWTQGLALADVFSQITEQLQQENQAAIIGALYFACVVGYTTRKDGVTQEGMVASLQASIPELMKYIAGLEAANKAKMN